MPLLVSNVPWEDISWTLFYVCLEQRRGVEFLGVVDRFSKKAHFILCRKVDDVTHVDDLLFRDIVRLHGIPNTICSDYDAKFLSHFWQTLWA